jgi:hypothetical protein
MSRDTVRGFSYGVAFSGFSYALITHHPTIAVLWVLYAGWVYSRYRRP